MLKDDATHRTDNTHIVLYSSLSNAQNGVGYECDCFESINKRFTVPSVLFSHAVFWTMGLVTAFYSMQQYEQLIRLQFFKLRIKAEELENVSFQH